MTLIAIEAAPSAAPMMMPDWAAPLGVCMIHSVSFPNP